MTSSSNTCEHGMPIRMGCDDCTIARLASENKAQAELLLRAVEALQVLRGSCIANGWLTAKSQVQTMDMARDTIATIRKHLEGKA